MFRAEWNRFVSHRMVYVMLLLLFISGIAFAFLFTTNVEETNIHRLSELSREELQELRDEIFQQLNSPDKLIEKPSMPSYLKDLKVSQVSQQLMKAVERKEHLDNNKSTWEKKLKAIQEKQGISIFQTPLSEKIFAKEIRILEELIHSSKPESTLQTETILKTRITDILWILWLFFLIYFLFLEMGDAKAEEFMKSLPVEERPIHISRFSLFLVLSFLGFILLNGPTFLWSKLSYSNNSYLAAWIYQFNHLKVVFTNHQLVLFWFCLRFLSGLGLAATFIFCIKRLRSIVLASLLLMILGLLSYGMAFFISIRSPVGFLRLLNLYGIAYLPESLLSGDWSVVGGYPLNSAVISVALCLALLILALFVQRSSFIYGNQWKPFVTIPRLGWKLQTSYYWLIQRGAVIIILISIVYWGFQMMSFQYEKSIGEKYISQYFLQYGGTMNLDKWDQIQQKNEEIELEEQNYNRLREKLLQSYLNKEEASDYQKLHESKLIREAWHLFYERALQAQSTQEDVLIDPLSTKVFLMTGANRFRLMRALLQSSLFSLFLFFAFGYYLDPSSAHIFKSTLHGKKDMWRYIVLWIFFASFIFTIIPWLERLYITQYIDPINWQSSIRHVVTGSIDRSITHVVVRQILLQWFFFLAQAGLLAMVSTHLKPFAVLIFIILSKFLWSFTSFLSIHPMAGFGYQWLHHPYSYWVALILNICISVICLYYTYRHNFGNRIHGLVH
ncbi:MAG: hypothetical protein GX978_02995 [Tissierellia bacterium]|nr:hypothetical protein [Tissierellia bacterium]